MLELFVHSALVAGSFSSWWHRWAAAGFPAAGSRATGLMPAALED